VAREESDEDKDETSKNVGKGRKRDLLLLETDSEGHPKLPDYDEATMSGNRMKHIFRSFFTHSYRMLQSLVNS
jgi:hypothetical protein